MGVLVSDERKPVRKTVPCIVATAVLFLTGEPAAAHHYDSQKLPDRAPCGHAKAWNDHRHGLADARRTTNLERLRHYRKCARDERRRKAIAKRIEAVKEARKQERSQWGTCSHTAPPASQSVLDCIKGGAIEYGQSYSWLVRVARCESGLNRLAGNPSGASGLFQFMPGTWRTTPFGGQSIWSAKWQSLAAAWMFRQGRSGEWVCQ